ncbi:MAG: flagellar protein export ATPase FliI [Algicola sp.]|nr:flagellar protein export ATPase FliI [Algicola sp.]
MSDATNNPADDALSTPSNKPSNAPPKAASNALLNEQQAPLTKRLERYKKFIKKSKPTAAGRLTRVVGLTLEAVGCRAPLGSLCHVETMGEGITAEIVGFSDDCIFLMPSESIHGVLPGARVVPLMHEVGIPVGMELLGRVIDGAGRPLDGLGPIITEHEATNKVTPTNPLNRRPIKEPLDVGVRAINSVITVGQGQRMGLFAGSGVGKSVLLGMMTRGTTADVVVVGLIGERGREVKEFIEEILGEEGRARSVVVAAPADNSPLMRLKGCETAATIAEYFRDQGMNVLLLLDSVTRYAQAQREIALAVGEPPATKGYPPSVFAKLPALVERAGNGGEGQGSITAFYTVLTEGDDMQDPIADAARAILDGHIVLSRELADSGHYPAIDVEKSISRVMPNVTTDEHQMLARQVKQLYSIYQQNKDLISIGAYTAGTNPEIDIAIQLMPALNEFLQQGMTDVIGYEECLANLAHVLQPLADAQAQHQQQQ